MNPTASPQECEVAALCRPGSRHAIVGTNSPGREDLQCHERGDDSRHGGSIIDSSSMKRPGLVGEVKCTSRLG